MKILQILPYYAPAWGYGGPPRVMFDYARLLVARGHKVTVYTSDAYRRDARIGKSKDVIDGVEIYYFKNVSNYLAWHKKKFFPIGFSSFLKKTVSHFDIIHISAIRNFMNLIAYPIIKASGVPYVMDAHGSLPVATKCLKMFAKLYDRLFTLPMIKNASVLFAQTKHEAELYKKLGASPGAIKLMPLSVDMEQFRNLPAKGLFRSKYKIGDNDKVITFLGRINKGKGLDVLLQVFGKISDSRDNVKLAIIGHDDGYLGEVQKKVLAMGLSDKVIFTGALYGDKKLEAYVDSDLFLFTPTYWEETSTASLEAMACGVPAVVTKQAEVPWIEEYEAGYNVSFDNIDGIVERIKEILCSKKNRGYAENARKLIEVKYNFQDRITEIEACFDRGIIEKRRL